MFTAHINEMAYGGHKPDVSAHTLTAVVKRYTDTPRDTIKRIGGVGGEVRVYDDGTFIGGIRKLGSGVHYYPVTCP